MTREEVLEMKAGEKLDAKVARLVLGKLEWFGSVDGYHHRASPYSRDISYAFQVVDKLKGHEFRIHNEYHNERWYWYCGIEQPEDLGEGFFSAEAEELPEAICKAALLTRLEVKE